MPAVLPIDDPGFLVGRVRRATTADLEVELEDGSPATLRGGYEDLLPRQTGDRGMHEPEDWPRAGEWISVACDAREGEKTITHIFTLGDEDPRAVERRRRADEQRRMVEPPLPSAWPSHAALQRQLWDRALADLSELFPAFDGAGLAPAELDVLVAAHLARAGGYTNPRFIRFLDRFDEHWHALKCPHSDLKKHLKRQLLATR